MIKFLEHGKTKMAEENKNWRKVKRFCYFPLKHFLALASGSELISECVPIYIFRVMKFVPLHFSGSKFNSVPRNSCPLQTSECDFLWKQGFCRYN